MTLHDDIYWQHFAPSLWMAEKNGADLMIEQALPDRFVWSVTRSHRKNQFGHAPTLEEAKAAAIRYQVVGRTQ